ncbi:mandelate racemase/muconate lactonizing enzyme family protein [Salinirubellus sp. GCM10025818]|jgi:2-dehydro-3-deoxyphosphogalactonate aldolase|uniref:mandelate racemase/muconate lactonizing enzyme family protein n=2 Tax=Natronomonadaceae TaxID=3402413 RepID=UPI00361ED772
MVPFIISGSDTIERNMEITNIEPYIVPIPPEGGEMVEDGHFWTETNWVFIEVETDEGVVGVGEANWTVFRARTVVQALEDMERFAVGLNPFDVETLRQRMYNGNHFLHTPGVVQSMVIGAIEMACWDIMGKVTGQPVYNLLGGKVNDRIRSYTYMHYKWMPPEPPEKAAEAARHYVDKGFTAVKLDPVRPKEGPRNPRIDELEYAEAAVAAVREEVGNEADILIGTHGQLYTHSARRLAARLEPYDPLWFEEPVPPENFGELREVVDSTSIPVSTGERLLTVHQMAQAVENGVRIIQPNVGLTGLLEARKMAGIAQAHYAQVAPWMYAGPIAGAASVHLCAAIPNYLLQESLEGWNGFHNDILEDGLEWDNGDLIPPEKPGLGVEFDRSVLESYAGEYRPESS